MAKIDMSKLVQAATKPAVTLTAEVQAVLDDMLKKNGVTREAFALLAEPMRAMLIQAAIQAAPKPKKHRTSIGTMGLWFSVNDQPWTDPKTGAVKPPSGKITVGGFSQRFGLTLSREDWLRFSEAAADLARAMVSPAVKDNPVVKKQEQDYREFKAKGGKAAEAEADEQ